MVTISFGILCVLDFVVRLVSWKGESCLNAAQTLRQDICVKLQIT